MRRAWLSSVTVAVLLAGGLLARAVNGPSTTPEGYAVLGLEDATLAQGVQVTAGDVGANLGTVTLRTGVNVTGAVAADTVRISRGARVGGLFCTIIDGPRKFSCAGVPVPVVDPSNFPLVQVLPGAADVRLRPRQRRAALGAGNYGAVRLGTRAALTLAGGTYSFESMKLHHRSLLLCAANCEIGVQDRVVLAGGVHVGGTAADGSIVVRIEVQGGRPHTSFLAGAGSAVEATVYAPAGTVSLGSGGRFTGSFIGRSVTVGSRAHVATVSTP
jgi:hypothetical protein